MEEKNKLVKAVFGDVVLGVHGAEFSALFSYQTGGLEALQIRGEEWLYRTVRPTFWRALTSNDAGSGFWKRSGSWMAADLYHECVDISVWLNGQECRTFRAPDNQVFGKAVEAESVAIRFTYETCICPAAKAAITYFVDPTGIRVDFQYEGKKGLPQLPCVGMRFLLPTCASRYRYEGLSGETYPDRKAGAQKGVFEVEGLPVTKYLKPQECGMHMDTQWLEIYRDHALNHLDHRREEHAIRFEACGEPFHFSCLPYTAQELENATHHEELPLPRRTVLCMMAAVRGVGGFDSWGQDVLEEYCVSGEEDHRFSFRIRIPRENF